MPDRRDDFAIRHVASLARLQLTRDEEVLYARQLGDILTYARQLLLFDTAATASTPPAGAAPMSLREDCVRPPVEREAVRGGAPDRKDDEGLFRVPRVIG
ncbi:MAG: aspartyl/glutamyl-tRNA amidotransferase subunit C [Acidobacteria bacterium]|nr:aspartyl/glutamyl-tRNA amidotransferase subunit C [Acidobacteriota bacterium]